MHERGNAVEERRQGLVEEDGGQESSTSGYDEGMRSKFFELQFGGTIGSWDDSQV